MHGTNYYCAGQACHRTTQHVIVRMHERTYYYCVQCGRRLEERTEYDREQNAIDSHRKTA